MNSFKSKMQHKFVLTLKPKINDIKKNDLKKNIQPSLPYEILNYIATFIDSDDEYTMISYLLAIPCAMYEIKKKFKEYFENREQYELIPDCIYKFMNEPVRNLSYCLIPIFELTSLLKYCIDDKYILERQNGKRFVIQLIKEQNKTSQDEIYNILKDKYYFLLKK